MNRKNFYFGQPVSEAELDSAFAEAETADLNQMVDLGATGILRGLTVSTGTGISITIGSGAAYTATGQRINVPANVLNHSVMTATGGATTAVGSGNERIVSVFLKFARSDSDARVDNNGNAVNFVSAESYSIVIRAGTEAPEAFAFPPALEADGVLLCDITRTFGQTNLSSAISTSRRQAYLPVKTWANGSALVEASLSNRLNAIVDGLANTSQGSTLVGSPLVTTGGSFALGAGTLHSQLVTLLGLAGIKSVAQTWTAQNTFNASATPTTPSGDEAIPSIVTTTRPQATGYKLLWESAGDNTGTPKVRLYSGKGSLGLVSFSVSINGLYGGTNWVADTASLPITVFSLNSDGIRMRRANAGTTPKGDSSAWAVNMTLDTNGQIDAGNQGTVTLYGSLRYYAATSDFHSVGIQFPRRFTTAPTSLTVGATVGTDSNVDQVVLSEPTRDGVTYSVVPFAAGAVTSAKRTLVVGA